MASQPEILERHSVDKLVKTLRLFDVEEFGTQNWRVQNYAMEKISFQADLRVRLGIDEVVGDSLLEFKKLQLLINQAVYNRAWRKHEFPIVKEFLIKQSWPFAHTLLQQNGTILNLLQNALYKTESLDLIEDAILDLIDIVSFHLLWLVNLSKTCFKRDSHVSIDKALNDKDDSIREIDWRASWACVACLCHMTHHMKTISVSAITRIVNEHELVSLVIMLLECKLWKRADEFNITLNNGQRNVGEDENHQTIETEEGLLWMTLGNILLNIRFDLTPYRMEAVKKLLPILENGKHLHAKFTFLEHIHKSILYATISNSETPSIGNVSVNPPSRISCMPCFEAPNLDWKKLAADHKRMWCESGADVHTVELLSQLYNFNDIEFLVNASAKCANCGSPAKNRCSVCQVEFYCCRPCQVMAWKSHKSVCRLLGSQEKNQNIF